MTLNISRWSREHEKLAKKILANSGSTRELPNLPHNMMDWIEAARPYVDGGKRDFLVAPFWIPIYLDTCDSQMIIGGRQIFKSTACTDFIAKEATTNSGRQVCYITHDDKSLSAFSKQRLRFGTFLTNSVLSQFMRHPGNVGEISLKNNNTIYLLTDNYQYRHIEGKSPTLCVIDEAQYQDLENFGKVTQTMMATKGKLKILGIGGESGSPYEKLWLETNQCEWFYDDSNWRDKLQFDNKGLVVEDYLIDVLKGKWVPQNPSVKLFNGYHIPQSIFPTIPLMEEDAINKYKVHPRFSLEYQKKILSESNFKSHVIGTFYNRSHRPVTREMVLSCMDPYRYMSLLLPKEISNLKKIFGEQITVGIGVDFGSGSSSYTGIAVLIWWHKSDRYQIAFIERRPPENQIEQAEYITQLFKDCCCDIGVGDLGYGANQIKIIQTGGHSVKTGISYEGLTDTKFLGCRTISDITKPLQVFYEKFDEHGEQVGRLQMDKTSSIELLIDSMQKKIPHPLYKTDETKSRCRLMIPSRYDNEVSFLLDDLTSITRKDLSELEDTIDDKRQSPRKEFNHPADSVMSIVYGIVSLKHVEKSYWNWA